MTGIVRFKHFSSQKIDDTLHIFIPIQVGTIVNRVWSSLKGRIKVKRQGKLMLLRILCVYIETSSLWAVFVNKKRCIRRISF